METTKAELQKLEIERNKLKDEFERSQANFTAFVSFFYLMFATSIVSDREAERPPQELLAQFSANSANGRRLSLVLDTLISNPVLATAQTGDDEVEVILALIPCLRTAQERLFSEQVALGN